MKKLFGALVASLLLGCLPAMAQIPCDRIPVVYDASTNGSTVLVTGLANRTIYVCGFHLMWGGTATVKLVRGTGTTCGTNETALTPAYSGVAQSVVIDSSVFFRGLQVAPLIDLCIKTSAGVAVQGLLFYAQR